MHGGSLREERHERDDRRSAAKENHAAAKLVEIVGRQAAGPGSGRYITLSSGAGREAPRDYQRNWPRFLELRTTCEILGLET
ncbi:hypothetical protein GCM10007898_01040 [Dyella flagellata]|uniref:Uncharacterized protein n=1 Tax=Dyella flagellata TaxID=1867833 RepID=A0ABQ5X4R8_9GAMM|nr:hypothetical protein GCM10007898_01040 [Dyella flagellata]